MEEVFSTILSSVNILYIFMCNLITYLIIDTIQTNKKKKLLSKGKKRLISTLSAIIIGLWLVYMDSSEDHTELINSLFYGFFIQFLTWDYCFKGAIKSLKKKFTPEDDELEEIKEDKENDDDNHLDTIF